jgi:hypothetical protein
LGETERPADRAGWTLTEKAMDVSAGYPNCYVA